MSSKVLVFIKLRCPVRIPVIFIQPIKEVLHYGNLVKRNNN